MANTVAHVIISVRRGSVSGNPGQAAWFAGAAPNPVMQLSRVPNPNPAFKSSLLHPLRPVRCYAALAENLLGADSFTLLPHLVALGVAYLLAVPIGWNREREERSRFRPGDRPPGRSIHS
jgi:hypothetical protein